MNTHVGIDSLESALIERAKVLAQEYLANGQRSRDQIVADANDRLRLREEREILAAKAQAERLFRQRVQAAEIKQHEEMDRRRWMLVRGVMEQLHKSLVDLTADEQTYLPLLRRYLAQAAAAIEGEALVAEVNVRDHARLTTDWESFCREAGITKRVSLAPAPLPCTGGVRVRNVADTIRVDNTFEGRLERMQDEVYQVVMERLFATTAHMGAAFGG